MLALAAHVGLIAWLALKPFAPAPLPAPERMTVTLSDDAGLTSTSPEPQTQAAPDKAPDIGEAPPPPAPEPKVVPRPEPPKPVTKPEVRPLPKLQPRPVMQPQPRPQPKPSVRPRPALQPRPTAQTQPARPQAARPQQQAQSSRTAPLAQPQRPTQRPGGSRVGADFLPELSGATANSTSERGAEAPFGPREQTALRAAIMRQIKPHWASPQGVDVELLVTQVRFRLGRDGRLVGEPVVINQTGQTASNAAQAHRHAGQAIKAVKQSEPFILPPDLYSHWQTVTSTFDRRLSR